MALATVDDVTSRLGRSVTVDETTRITAFLDDVTALIEDYCGRDLGRRVDQDIALTSEGGWTLAVPARYSTALVVSAVVQEGQAVTGWTLRGRQLVAEDGSGWLPGELTVTASWGYTAPPASLKAVACSEVIRWMALRPGVSSEKVGEVEVAFSGAATAQTLSPASRLSLRPYRRMGAGSLSLVREGPVLDLRGPHVL
ncbi:phage gp6-like head-tail connector protein [Streptomyces sp. NPDC055036]